MDEQKSLIPDTIPSSEDVLSTFTGQWGCTEWLALEGFICLACPDQRPLAGHAYHRIDAWYSRWSGIASPGTPCRGAAPGAVRTWNREKLVTSTSRRGLLDLWQQFLSGLHQLHGLCLKFTCKRPLRLLRELFLLWRSLFQVYFHHVSGSRPAPIVVSDHLFPSTPCGGGQIQIPEFDEF
jgi:hypothetical protein